MSRSNSKLRARNITILLITLGIILLIISLLILRKSLSPDVFLQEIGKTLLTLASGSFIGGLVQLFFSNRQKSIEESAKELNEKNQRDARIQAFRQELLAKLIVIFNSVDSSSLLIRAHKSARTYGEQMRSQIIPSNRVWETLSAFDCVGDFLSETYERMYNKAFVDRFELVKKLLRFQVSEAQIVASTKTDADYLQYLRDKAAIPPVVVEEDDQPGQPTIDEELKAPTSGKLSPKDNLVNVIIRQKIYPGIAGNRDKPLQQMEEIFV